MTIVGERGVNLSGGQKARVSLARCLYSDSQLYLLDDPLAAVDPIVGKRILERCLGPNSFLREKTRVLITHHTQFKSYADYLIQLDSGKIVFQGPPQDFVADREEKALEIVEEVDLSKPKVNISEFISKKNVNSNLQNAKPDPYSIIDLEDRSTGGISSQVYRSLFGYGGGLWRFCICIGVLACAQGSLFAVLFWINHWAQESESVQKENLSSNLIIFVALVAATMLIAVMGAFGYFTFMVKSARNLHDAMLKSVVGAPIRFFEANPLGRILNRFSRDQSAVDELLPMTSYDFLRCTVTCIGAMILVFLANPWILLSLIFILPLFYTIRNHYVACSRELKRLDGMLKSPVFEMVSSTMEGLVSVRAFGRQDVFMQVFQEKVDANNKIWFSYIGLARWIGFRMDYLVAVIIGLTAFLGVLLRTTLNPADVALSLTYVMQITGTFQWTIRQSAETENLMTSVERIVSYCNLPREEKLNEANYDLPKNWPSEGRIEMRDLHVRYREDLAYVLRGVNTVIEDKEKVGVCGRTGSGKSTWFKACFRLVEPCGGTIFIDGVDICKITLNDLRSKLSIIPQDPVIFSGTFRYNLDPFNLCTDDEINNVLEILELNRLISRLPQGLETPVAESGSNFSAGEGQLICVARALLKPSRILFIDEATANIDKHTDQIIQKVIRHHFKDRTVLTIAHRLDTIIDSDKIVVMDKGVLAESGPPAKLLEKPGGIFNSMMASAKMHAN
eukprot:TRINITY_DN20660_c0_g1_i1.p1 TRINITY_DN20660_c0_g1~~TRINITY_DN20660_c0_g1_i1.p1  ORF type:complete len:828 (-),score=189.95 TRINITY_DN20660_c0_g1_i1:24-2222(-)